MQSLAIDTSGGLNDGNLYVARCNPSNFCVEGGTIPGSKANVLRLSAAGAVLDTLAVPDPQGGAVDDDGNVYVVDGPKVADLTKVSIHKFDPAGDELAEFPFSDGFDRSVGIAANSACRKESDPGVNFYVSNARAADSYVRAYGPPPDPTIPGCEPRSVAPTINAQYALEVETASASLQAQIDPEFWPDATYQLEYGTGKCSSGGRPQTTPELALTTSVTSEDIKTGVVDLAGLTPGTTYNFRFVSESTGGGPTRGVGQVEDGEEGTFTTYTAPLITRNCANEGLRAQANPDPATGLRFSQSLAACRAYELVSPPDKNGGDITDGEVDRLHLGAQGLGER